MLISLLTFGISIGLYGNGFWLTPFSEWVLVLVYLNFNFFLAFSNHYYESIHPHGKLIPDD